MMHVSPGVLKRKLSGSAGWRVLRPTHIRAIERACRVNRPDLIVGFLAGALTVSDINAVLSRRRKPRVAPTPHFVARNGNGSTRLFRRTDADTAGTHAN